MKVLVVPYYGKTTELMQYIDANVPNMKIVKDTRSAHLDITYDGIQPLEGDLTVFDFQHPTAKMSDFLAELGLNALGNIISSAPINNIPLTWIVLESSSAYTQADVQNVLDYIANH